MNTETNSNVTFFGGRTAEVLLIDGSAQRVKVRQLLLNEYETAIPLLKDEIALTAFFCVPAGAPSGAPSGGALEKPLDKGWAVKLQPKSYELVYQLAQEVNAEGFFGYAARHLEKERAEEERWARVAGDLPVEFLERARELSPSPSTPRRPR